jgi:hypothetical protein
VLVRTESRGCVQGPQSDDIYRDQEDVLRSTTVFLNCNQTDQLHCEFSIMTSSTSLLQHSQHGLPKPSVNEHRTPVADTYGLTRNKTESARLNAQHDVWKTNVGFLLHPRIASSLGKSSRIGDLGTGTGVWILELADQLGKHSGAT